MTKGALVKAIAGEFDIKTKQATKVINSLAGIATTEMTTVGQFTFPGLCRIKSRVKPATKATEKKMWEDRPCKSSPGAHHREGFPRGSLEEERLRMLRCSQSS